MHLANSFRFMFCLISPATISSLVAACIFCGASLAAPIVSVGQENSDDTGVIEKQEPKADKAQDAKTEESNDDKTTKKRGQSKNVPAQALSQEDLFRAMTLTSKAFRESSGKISKSLVTIESFGGVSAIQGRIGGIRKQGEGNTTGIMISSDGYVLTSTFNFIQQPTVISVITSDGERRVATVMGRDDTRKLCLLKINDVSEMPVPETVPLDEITVGQWVVSMGVGYGDTSPALSMGIISAKNRIGGRAIQTDANISPANYGGPLVDLEGRLLGMCVPMNPQSQAIGAGVEWYDSGIGFAIPLSGLEKLIERLKTGDHIRPAFLGIQAIANPEGKGLFIQRVVQDTPAAENKLLVEDLILQVNGEPVNDMLGLRQILNKLESGDEIELTVFRAEEDEEDTFTLKLGATPRPKGEAEQLEPPKIR